MSVSPGSGDVPDFVSLFKRIAPSIVTSLSALFGPALNREDIEDCLADAVVTFLKRRTTDSDRKIPDDVRLYVIARSKAIDRLRARSRRPKETPLFSGEAERLQAPAPVPPEPDLAGDSTRLREDLEAILAGLSDVDRDIILSFAAAKDERTWTAFLVDVDAIGLSANALRVRKSRILRSIREQLIRKGHRPSQTPDPADPKGDSSG